MEIAHFQNKLCVWGCKNVNTLFEMKHFIISSHFIRLSCTKTKKVASYLTPNQMTWTFLFSGYLLIKCPFNFYQTLKCSDCVSTFGTVLFVCKNHGRIVGSSISQAKLKQIIWSPTFIISINTGVTDGCSWTHNCTNYELGLLSIDVHIKANIFLRWNLKTPVDKSILL